MSYKDMHNQTDGQRTNGRRPLLGLGNGITQYQSIKKVAYGVNGRTTTLSSVPPYNNAFCAAPRAFQTHLSYPACPLQPERSLLSTL